jgi:DNA-binding winged helix-turn-helix (wHTH) protein/Tol biopolymer transport system component
VWAALCVNIKVRAMAARGHFGDRLVAVAKCLVLCRLGRAIFNTSQPSGAKIVAISRGDRMATPLRGSQWVHFGEFELDLTTRELWTKGTKQTLAPQSFQILQLFLERRSQLVTHYDLVHHLWPSDTFVDYDQGLKKAINRLREALNDSAEHPRFIETLPRSGYRFIADVEFDTPHRSNFAEQIVQFPGAVEAAQTTSMSGQTANKTSFRFWKFAAMTCAVAAITTAGFLWLTRPPAVPVVEAVTQLTDDGLPKQGPLLTDGARIYFNEGAEGSWKIVQVSTAGGETSIVPSGLANSQLVDLAPDDSSLLVSAGAANTAAGELWTVPLPSGNPRRLGDIVTRQAGFFPDGRLIFAKGTELYVADNDGSGVRKLLSIHDSAYCPSVSRDGKQIVFRASPLTGHGTSDTFVKVAADGSGSREILRSRPDAILVCAAWSLDARYLFYEAYRPGHPGRADIWALPLRTPLEFGDRKSIQLTTGPLSYEGLAQSPRDGKRIFALGTKPRGELVRYDIASKHIIPFLAGISATDPSFSRDGNWVAYISFPDHTLWRSRADGSDRLQLTYSPMEVELPVISQDGRKVAFRTLHNEVYVVAMDGGPLRKIEVKRAFSGSISPDGNLMVLTVLREGAQVREGNTELQILDLQNGALSNVPSSQGLAGVFWVNPDTLVAVTGDFTKIMAFNFKTSQWTTLTSDHVNNWMPSPDGKYLYYATAGTEPEAKRVRVSDSQVETIFSLKDLRRVDNHGITQISVAPDGSPVFTRDIGTQEIYALTVKWP